MAEVCCVDVSSVMRKLVARCGMILKCAHRFMYLNAWPPVTSTSLEGCGAVECRT